MKRRLELAGLPGSFFELEHKDSELHVSFGPLGRNVPSRVRKFPSELAALAEAEKLCNAHLAKGYVEKIEAPPPPDPFERLSWSSARVAAAATGTVAPFNPALEAACDGDDPGPWEVFADWLVEQGDPRGELALGAMRGMAGDARGVYIQAISGVRLRGDFGIEGIRLDDIKHGFLLRATVGLALDEPPYALRGLVSSPLAASLRELTIGLGATGDWTPALDVLSASPLAPRLQRLVFDASNALPKNAVEYRQAIDRECRYDPDDLDGRDPTDKQIAKAQRVVDRRVADVAPVRFAPDAQWSALTALESLTIEGPFRGDLGELALPNLRTLIIRSDRLRNLTAIAAADCPHLEHLELWCGPDDTPDLAPLADAFPSLRRLSVFDVAPTLLAPLRSAATLDTKLPDGAEVSRYTDPLDRGLPRDLPRGGEPPSAKKKRKAR